MEHPTGPRRWRCSAALSTNSVSSGPRELRRAMSIDVAMLACRLHERPRRRMRWKRMGATSRRGRPGAEASVPGLRLSGAQGAVMVRLTSDQY
jgi:hypothetical protein